MHTEVCDATIVTVGVTIGFIVMEIGKLLAVAVDVQVAFEVNVQLTLAPLVNELDEKTEELVPAFTPFTFHWNAGVVPPFVGVAVKVTLAPAQLDV